MILYCNKCDIDMLCKEIGWKIHYGNGHCYNADLYECSVCKTKTLFTTAGSHNEPRLQEDEPGKYRFNKKTKTLERITTLQRKRLKHILSEDNENLKLI